MAEVPELRGPIAFFSLEMSHEQIAKRMVAARAQVQALKISRGDLSEAEMELGSELYTKGAEKIGEAQARGEIREDISPALIIHHFTSAAESWFAHQAWFCQACHGALPGEPGEELDEIVMESAVKLIMDGLRPR